MTLYCVSVVFPSPPSSHSPSTAPPRTSILLRLFEPSSFSWRQGRDAIVCCSVLQCVAVYCSVLQYVESTASTPPIRPAGSLRWAHPTFSQHLKQSKFEDFCSVKETYFCTAKTSSSIFFVCKTYKKSEKRYQREELLARSL